MASSSGLRNVGSTTGSKAQNAEFFGTDLTANIESDISVGFLITFSFSAAVTLQWTKDSGSNWSVVHDVNGTSSFNADETYTAIVFVRSTDTFNLRIPTAGGATVDICDIQEISG